MAFTQRYLRMLLAGESSNHFFYSGADTVATVIACTTFFSDAYADLRQGDWIHVFPPAGTSWGSFAISASSAGGVNHTFAGTSCAWA